MAKWRLDVHGRGRQDALSKAMYFFTHIFNPLIFEVDFSASDELVDVHQVNYLVCAAHRTIRRTTSFSLLINREFKSEKASQLYI